MKIYENYFGSVQYRKRYDNGLRITGTLLYEDRLPLNNTSDFSFFGNKEKEFTPNYPYELINENFTPNQALIAGLDIQFKPGQRYIEFPDNRLALGSKYPTLALSFRAGIPDLFGSDVNYEKWEFSLWDNINFKLKGVFKYRFGIGGFSKYKVTVCDGLPAIQWQPDFLCKSLFKQFPACSLLSEQYNRFAVWRRSYRTSF